MTLVVDSGNHVAAKAIRAARYYRRTAAASIGSAHGVGRTKPNLITPQDFLSSMRRLCLDSRESTSKPALDILGVSLIGPPSRLLGSNAPSSQVSSHRPAGDDNPKLLCDQLSNSLAAPQITMQLQLPRRMINNRLGRPCSLPRGQLPPSFVPAARFGLQTFHPMVSIGTSPRVHSHTAHVVDPGHLTRTMPLHNRLHCTAPNRFLCLWRQRSEVLYLHNYTTN